MNAATGVTPNNPNDTILKNNNQLISIEIYKICIYIWLLVYYYVHYQYYLRIVS